MGERKLEGLVARESVYRKIKELWDAHPYDEASAMQELIDWLETTIPAAPKLSLDLSNGSKLVAEVNPDRDYKEIFVGIEKDGVYWQDLAIVREDYKWEEDDFHISHYIPKPGEYEVLVYGDAANEDWTKSFQIQEWKEEL